jgi:hypothetical protein
MSRPHHGPHLVPTLEEVKRIYEAVRHATDPVGLALCAKCEAVLVADPKFRRPHDGRRRT